MTNRSRSGSVHRMAVAPRETDFLWPDRKTGPWWVKVWWRVQRGVPTPVGFSITSWVDEKSTEWSGPHNALPWETEDVELPKIDGQFIRALPMGNLLDVARKQLADFLNLHSTREPEADWPQEWVESLRKWQAELVPEREAVNSGRRGRDLGDAHYREVAEVYAAALQAGESPTKAVLEHFTVSKSAAAKKVARARDRGFLPKTSRGRVGPLQEDL